MLHDLQPLGLTAAAKRLAMDPFELIQLLIATDGVPKDLVFTAAQVDGLVGKGGVEAGWWDEAEFVEDKNARRRRVRAALKLMLDRELVGPPGTRPDNLWRGLDAAEQKLIRDALAVLVDDEVLERVPHMAGNHVAIRAEGKERVVEIVEGRTEHPSLSALFEG